MTTCLYAGKMLEEAVALAVRGERPREVKCNRCDRILFDAERLKRRQGDLQGRIERLQAQVEAASRSARDGRDSARLSSYGTAATALGFAAAAIALPFLSGTALIIGIAGAGATGIGAAIGYLSTVRQSLGVALKDNEARRLASDVETLRRDLSGLDGEWTALWRQWESHGCNAEEFAS